jgi:CRISPR/Cas system-associated exonuclease Cas4 (RecB family)
MLNRKTPSYTRLFFLSFEINSIAMKPFVDRIAEKVLEHNLSFEHLTIIVPSQRMIAYLERALFQAVGKPILLPKIQTIDTWMQQLVAEPVIDKTQALFELYRIFEANPIEHDLNSFDSFMTWGHLLLSDFDEIDRYLIQPEQLFKNLRDVREIENWSFNAEKLSIGQQKFMAFWDKLGPYYHAFSERLKILGVTTKGKVYRSVAEEIDRVFKKDNQATFVFAGFNALSESELSVFKQLTSMGRGLVFMDSDVFYLHDVYHEAGAFQRVLLDRLQVKSLPFIEDELAHKKCNIQLIECAQVTGQANVIGSILSELSETELNETLVLLADEQLLGSLLHHLPQSIGKANITLGMPLNQTSLRLWVDLIFRLQEAFIRRGAHAIYHKDFTQYVHHPFILCLVEKAELHEIRRIETKIVQQNWHFIDRKELNMSERLSQLNALLFRPWKNDWNLALETIQQLNQFLDDWLDETHLLEKAIVRSFSDALIGLQNMLLEPTPDMTIATFKNLFNQHWSSVSLAYFGNPLNGLQIMGLLETRGLDFKRLLVLGLNEGTMPPTNPIQTLIPMDLRRFYGLPTPRDKQGLFAHHFYRLLHQMEKAFITFSSAAEAIGSNEPSRFIQQLELELAVINPQFSIEKSYYTLENEEQIGNVSIPKTPELLERIDQLLQEGLTYSKISKFLECPLDFYYRYLLRIGEENKVEEEVESNTLGTIIHEVLERLFEPYTQLEADGVLVRNAKAITPDALTKMMKDAPLLVDEAFANHFSKDKSLVETGTNHINYVMANEIVLNVLNKEKRTLIDHPDKSLFIVGLEKELEVQTEFQINGTNKPVRIFGIIDRLDQWNGDYRIIDYKSGAVEDSNVTTSATKELTVVENIIKSKRGGTKSYALQLMLYCYLYRENYHRDLNLSGIFSFISISKSPHYLNVSGLEDESVADTVVEVLKKVLEMMYDEATPFEHNPKAHYCEYC